jgi:hypothetical protein
MPVAPMYGGGYGGNGCFGGFGGDWGWIILLLLFASGGWNNGFGGNMGGFAPYAIDTGVQSGFNQASVMAGIGDINAGINGIQTSLCNGFAGVNQTVSNGFAQAEIANNARQIADMQQMFSLQSSLQNCCCENRSNIADLKYTVATENCADRTQSMMNTRDIIENQTRNTQAILDKLCQQEIQAKDDLIGQLRQEVLFARGQASQIAQNEQIVNSIYNRLDQCPVGTTPVFGRTPIFTCNQNTGCGCGM